MRYALLLLLVGCAGNQSAFPIMPRPPAFSPVEDAPITIGQPGHVAPAPERSPYTRVLPQTPETMRQPGIWAASDPFTPTILDVEFPSTPKVSAEAAAAERRCVVRYARIFYRVEELRARAFRHAKGERRCITAALFAECMAHEARQSRDADLKRLASDALDREKRDCPDGVREVIHFINEVERVNLPPDPSEGDMQ